MSNEQEILQEDINKAYQYPKDLYHVSKRLEQRITKEKKRKGTLYGTMTVMAASLFFIFLVNTSTSFVYALSNIPILNRISQIVLFDESLKRILENDDIQYVGLSDTNEKVVLKLPYVIADEKNLILFFQIDNASFSGNEDYQIDINSVHDLTTDETYTDGFFSSSFINGKDVAENLGLIQVRTTFTDFSLPQSIELSVTYIKSTAIDEENIAYSEKDYTFKIDLNEFKSPKIFPLQKDFMIEGIRVSFDEIRAYPTSTEVHYVVHKENENELTLEFDLLEDGKQFPLPANIHVKEGYDNYDQHTIQINKDFFSQPSSNSLIISGYHFIEESEKFVALDIKNKTLSRPIKNMELLSVSQYQDATTLVFKAKSSTSEPPVVLFENEQGELLSILNFRHTTHFENTSYVYEIETKDISKIMIEVKPHFIDLGENNIEIPINLLPNP